MSTPEVTRLVLCKDSKVSLPIQYGSTVFATPQDLSVCVKHRVFQMPRITHLDCQVPTNLSFTLLDAFANIQSLTLHWLPPGANIVLAELSILTTLVLMEVDQATVALPPALRVCKLGDGVRVIGALPETLETLVFADEKDWTVPERVEHVYFTGNANDLIIPGNRIKNVVAKFANLKFTNDCSVLEQVVSESDVSFQACDLSMLRVYIAGDVPPPCPNLKYYGLYFGDDSLFLLDDGGTSSHVDSVVQAARRRFSESSHVFVSPSNLVVGRHSFLCNVNPARENFIRVSTTATPSADCLPYEFVVEELDDDVEEYVTIGVVPEEVDAVEGEEPCIVCFGKMVAPESIYSCGIHALCQVCVAKARQMYFPITEGLPGAPALEYTHLHVCPTCRAPKGVEPPKKRTRE